MQHHTDAAFQSVPFICEKLLPGLWITDGVWLLQCVYKNAGNDDQITDQFPLCDLFVQDETRKQ